MGNQGGSSPHWKEEMRAVEIFSFNFFVIVVQQQQHNPPLDSEPDPSGILLLLSNVLPPLLVFVTLLPPIFSALQISPLFGLDNQAVLFPPAVRAGPLPQHIFWPSWPHSTHRQN